MAARVTWVAAAGWEELHAHGPGLVFQRLPVCGSVTKLSGKFENVCSLKFGSIQTVAQQHTQA